MLGRGVRIARLGHEHAYRPHGYHDHSEDKDHVHLLKGLSKPHRDHCIDYRCKAKDQRHHVTGTPFKGQGEQYPQSPQCTDRSGKKRNENAKKDQ